MGCKESEAEIKQRAELTCLKIGKTRNMDALERANLIQEFGISDARTIKDLLSVIESAYSLGYAGAGELCVDLLVNPNNMYPVK